MKVPESSLEQLRTEGYAIVEGFLAKDELADAHEGLWLEYPRPEEFFAAPERFEHLARDMFAGVKLFPYQSWAINRLAFHPDLVDAAERFLGATALDLYKVELWAKYSGAVNYGQPLHRDFGSHSLVVARRDGRWPQLTSFIMLSDVTEEDGPTKLVPVSRTADVPLVLPAGPGTARRCPGVGDRTGRHPAALPQRRPAPRLPDARRWPEPVLTARRLQAQGDTMGRQDVLAQPGHRPRVPRGHGAGHRARARPVRLPPAGPRVLERADPDRRAGPLPGDGHERVPQRGGFGRLRAGQRADDRMPATASAAATPRPLPSATAKNARSVRGATTGASRLPAENHRLSDRA
ncbi:MAG: hypothetical protein E6G17_11920, partial [Actinobacteria bacterium]